MALDVVGCYAIQVLVEVLGGERRRREALKLRIPRSERLTRGYNGYPCCSVLVQQSINSIIILGVFPSEVFKVKEQGGA